MYAVANSTHDNSQYGLPDDGTFDDGDGSYLDVAGVTEKSLAPDATLLTTCKKVVKGKSCLAKVTRGSKFCEDHTCTHTGCVRSKRKKDVQCKQHARLSSMNDDDDEDDDAMGFGSDAYDSD